MLRETEPVPKGRDRSPGAAGSGVTDSSPRTRSGDGQGRGKPTLARLERRRVFTWETKQGGHDATVKSRGKSKTEYNHGTLCGSAENNAYTVK